MNNLDLSYFVDKLNKRQDTEHQQAAVRILVGLTITPYLYFAFEKQWFGSFSYDAIYGGMGYCLAGLFIFLSILFFPKVSPTRRTLGMLTDTVFASYMMIVGGAVTAGLCGGYLWISIANGLRFGKNYLYLGYAFSLVSFISVLTVSEYWHQNLSLGILLLLWCIVLPLYVAKLLDNLENTMTKLENANQSKTQFLMNMCHEVRIPLTAILGFTHQLQKEKLKVEVRKSATRTITKNAEHLLHVINEILDLSKIEANRFDINKREVHLFKFLEDLNTLMAERIAKKGIEFEINYKFPLPETISTDETRLKQVLINLCNFALQTTDQGYIRIRVEFDAPMLIFSVQDTGMGMKTSQRESLFGNFAEKDISKMKNFGSHNLELTLSKQIINRLGGDISVLSTIGKGTTFTFEIDAGEIAGLTLRDEKPAIDYSSQFDFSSDAMQLEGKVLLVEDNLDNQALVKLYLEDAGLNLDIASNGKEGVEKACAEEYDLILMDMIMPILGGLDAVRQLRAQKYTRPIVMLTGNAFENSKRDSMEAGCNDFLIKPIEVDKLMMVLSRYCRILEGAGAEKSPQDEPIVSTLMGKSEKYDRMVIRFVEKLPEFQQALEQAFNQSKIELIKSEAHRLKGVGGNYGFMMLTEICIKIEEAVKSQNFEIIKDYMLELDKIISRIQSGIQKHNAA